jgi:outer membrane protein assembly factor BamB
MHCLRAFLVLLLATAPALAGDWPQWLGPRRDGASPDKIAPWQKEPKKLWSQPAGEGYSVPVVAAGRVFVHARVAGKDEEEVIALDARTGKALWRTTYARGPFFSILNTGPQSTPCVVQGKVYTFGITGVLTCLGAENGQQHWQTDVYKKLGVPLPRFGVTCSPLVIGDRVLVSVGGKGSAVVAFDADSGEIAWKALDGPISTASPIVYLNRARKEGAALEAVFVNGRSLVALNPFDGALSWEYVLSDQPLGTSPSPVASGELLLASSNTLGGRAIKLTVAGEKLQPEAAWLNAELTGYFSTPVAMGKDHIYMPTTVLLPQPASTLRCVEVKTGKIAWSQDKVGVFQVGLIRTGDEKLLVLDDSGLVRLIQHDPKGYRELARAQVCGATMVNPALADGLLLVRDGKSVNCWQLADQ